MPINNPLIKSRQTDRIINKTADIFKLLKNDEREERSVMAVKPFNTLETQRVLAGLDFSSETKITSKIAQDVHATFEAKTRLFNHLPRTFNRFFAVSGAPASPSTKLDETPSDAPKFRK